MARRAITVSPSSARALGLGERIGSLVAGKAADITAVDFSSIELVPCYDPVSHLVYAAGREHVSHVWVNGKMLLNNRTLNTLDEQELLRKAKFWHQRMESGPARKGEHKGHQPDEARTDD